MNNVMVDLETLGVSHDAVFPILAAVVFDPFTGETGDLFYENIDIDCQLKLGRSVDASVIEWWFSQGESARNEIVKKGNDLDVVLHDFRRFLPVNTILWTKGIDFDIPKLNTAYSGKTPWKYYNVRDVRTVLKIADVANDHVEFVGEKHHALDDCYHQIKLLALAFQKLGIKHG